MLFTFLSLFIAAPACTPIPQRAWEWTVESHARDEDGVPFRSTRDQRIATQSLGDLDGDGFDDWVVPIVTSKTKCPEDAMYEVWLGTAKGCGAPTGKVGPGLVERDGAVIVAHYRMTREVRLPMELIEITRRFERKKNGWVKVDEQRSGGVCHHCGTWSCSAPREVE